MSDTCNRKSVKIHLKLAIGLLEGFTTSINLFINLAKLTERVGAGFIIKSFHSSSSHLHYVQALQNKSQFWLFYTEIS